MNNSEIVILLVDDEPDILEFMEYNLKKEGSSSTSKTLYVLIFILFSCCKISLSAVYPLLLQYYGIVNRGRSGFEKRFRVQG